MHLAIVIPVYNEEKVIRGVIEGLPKKIKGIDKITVLAVDDGSTDNSRKEIEKTKATLIPLPINLGYGGASNTGLQGALKINADITVTFDGDGQHNPGDIEKIIEPILSGKADVVIGNRFENSKGMPITKRIGIKIINIIIYLSSGHLASDSQSGLKAFSMKSLGCLHLSTLGMEFASEVIMESKKNNLKMCERPVKTIYTSYSKSKGQSVFNGVNIITKIIHKRLGG